MAKETDHESSPGRHKPLFPAFGLYGLLILLLAWFFNWGMSGLRTHFLFFPQWLGYCLVVSAWAHRRKGSCLLTRNPLAYLVLFFISIPVWWLFEGLNLFTRNWAYLGRVAFSDFEYFIYATLSFSTVIPAVFSTAELLATFSWTQRFSGRTGFGLSAKILWLVHGAGWGMLLLMLVFPRIFFPFMWLSIFFILDPLNVRCGRDSLIAELSRGNARPLVVYGLAPLVCGFFWELWNVFSFPKWVYSIPCLDVLHVFEMPLAGYGGYVPFGWELYAVYQLAGCMLSGPFLRVLPTHRMLYPAGELY